MKQSRLIAVALAMCALSAVAAFGKAGDKSVERKNAETQTRPADTLPKN